MLIGYGYEELFLGQKTPDMTDSTPFWMVCCIQCWHMTRYATQEFISRAFEATGQPLWDHRELEKQAAREQQRAD